MITDTAPDCRPERSTVDIATRLGMAEQACRERGIQFTTLRRNVLEIILRAGRPIGAYDLIKELEKALDRRISPPTVYRTLEFLVEQGFSSRIESRNAFVPEAHPDHPHACAYFICEHCGSWEEVETPTIDEVLGRDAVSRGFRIRKRIVEIQGTCASCFAAHEASELLRSS